MSEKQYIGTYIVYRVFKKSCRKQILSREEAKRLTQSFPSSNTSMVCFDKQFSSEKYYK